MVDLGRSGSFRVRDGVKTSLVTDSENEIVLTPFILQCDSTSVCFCGLILHR